MSTAYQTLNERQITLPIPNFLISFLGSGSQVDGARPSSRIEVRPPPKDSRDEHATISCRINPESVRAIAYVWFRGMCLFSIFTKWQFTAPALLNPIKNDGFNNLTRYISLQEKQCPPFERFGGRGFNIYNESHLQEAFGFNNICVNWDYSPSRELTAMFYPLFEYSLLAYIILDFLLIAISYKKGFVTQTCWTLARFMLPIKLFLCAMFRMIFIVIAYRDVRGHTAGFLGLQIMLIVVATLNVLYMFETQVPLRFGPLVIDRKVLVVYFTLNILVGAVKLYLTAYAVFALGDADIIYPKWALERYIGPFPVGRFVDIVWMIFNAIIPLFVAFQRSRTEPDIIFKIDLEEVRFGPEI